MNSYRHPRAIILAREYLTASSGCQAFCDRACANPPPADRTAIKILSQLQVRDGARITETALAGSPEIKTRQQTGARAGCGSWSHARQESPERGSVGAAGRREADDADSTPSDTQHSDAVQNVLNCDVNPNAGAKQNGGDRAQHFPLVATKGRYPTRVGWALTFPLDA